MEASTSIIFSLYSHIIRIYLHIIFSLTHARPPSAFKYLKQAGRANFRDYLQKIVSTRRDEIVSKRRGVYQ